jgi:hypothetical protein
MINGKLTQSNRESETFDVFGECYICLKSTGSGSVSIQRKIGPGFEVLTTDIGQELTFVGDGVLFNGKISSNKRLPHRLVGDGEIEYFITQEDR